MAEKIIATLPNGKAIACREITVNRVWAALRIKRDALLAQAEAVQAQLDALVEADWQRDIAEMGRERALAAERMLIEEIEAEALASLA
jgi:hypothetical protein